QRVLAGHPGAVAAILVRRGGWGGRRRPPVPNHGWRPARGFCSSPRVSPPTAPAPPGARPPPPHPLPSPHSPPPPPLLRPPRPRRPGRPAGRRFDAGWRSRHRRPREHCRLLTRLLSLEDGGARQPFAALRAPGLYPLVGAPVSPQRSGRADDHRDGRGMVASLAGPGSGLGRLHRDPSTRVRRRAGRTTNRGRPLHVPLLPGLGAPGCRRPGNRVAVSQAVALGVLDGRAIGSQRAAPERMPRRAELAANADLARLMDVLDPRAG